MATSAFAAGILTAMTALALPAAPQGKRGRAEPPRPLETFAGSLSEARERARLRNVPLLVVGILEEVPFDEKEHHDIVRFREDVLGDQALAEASSLAVVIVANNRHHEQVEVVEEREGVKTTRKLCAVYRTGECTQHMRQFEQLYLAYNIEGDLRCPFAIVETPAGEPALRVSTGHAPLIAELLATLKAVRAKAGEGFTEAGLAEVLALLERGRRVEPHRPAEALAAFEGVLARTQASAYAAEAREKCEALLAQLGALRDEALEWLRSGRTADGYGRLEELAAQAGDTDFGKEMVRLLRKAETDKETREAVRALKREREAEALLEEARALLERGEEREGARKVRQLLQRFQGTAAAERAKATWPELVRDG